MSDVLKVAEYLARTPRILVVDDELVVRMMFDKLAASYEVTVSSVSSPEEALALLAKNAYDLVFLDIKFETSTSTGMDALREINRRGDDTHVIIMSGSVNLHDIMHDANRLGVLSFMAKPIHFDVEFLKVILRRLNVRVTRRDESGAGGGTPTPKALAS